MVVAAGCKPSPPPTAPSVPSPPVPQKLLVIEANAVAERVKDLWQTRGEGTLDVEAVTWDELSAQPARWAGADAVIFPAELMGDLTAGYIVPFPERVLEEPSFAWREVFDVVRRRAVMWDRRVVAVPLTVHVPVLWYRGDVWEQHQWQPPRTWSELARQLEMLRQGDSPVEGRTVEPLAAGWAARTLLVRAAAYAQHPNYFSVLFHPDTMDALISTPPFVRALEELCRDTVREGLDLAPEQCLPWAMDHKLAVAVGGWPVFPSATPMELGAWRVAQLPGAAECFDRRHERWQERVPTAQRVTLLGYGGLLGAVTTKARNQRQAASLLAWITGPEWGGQIVTAHRQALPIRASQAGQFDLGSADNAAGHLRDSFVQVIVETLNNPQVMAIPAIPGQRQYLAALDEAVRKAVQGELSPKEALEQASQQWNAISDRLGHAAQAQAYRKSLGL